ncbi:ribbon-helix-helix protein, CopG family [Sulfuricurvum sp.]|uniref:ribbon-helix-helix protein, CopG family n=1 Tax=Sulfuricurvum sp. TaxID=2025608 RepID=UPI003BB55FF8
MTKKMTITLDENFIDELSQIAHELGKKKTQVIREALQDYFDVQAITKTVQEYKMGTLKTISHADMRKALGV